LYYNLKKEYAGIDKTSNYKKLMEAVLKEIEKRRRTTIGWKPANPELKTA
jgi:hypothetical protein